MVTKRRVLVVGMSLMSLSLSTAAQETQKVYKIGWLAPGPPTPGGVYHQFILRARELGYVEGKNLSIQFREVPTAIEGKDTVDALVRQKVDLLVAQAPMPLQAARSSTETVPIVTFFIGDPIQMGVTKSLARPSSNVTGFTWDTGVVGIVKSLELMKEITPSATHFALLWNLDNDSHPFYLKEFERHARAFGLSTVPVGVRRSDELEGAFRKMKERKVSAVIIFSDPFTVRYRNVLSPLLTRFAMPAMWGSAAWPLAGAVITLGPNVDDQPRRAAEYMDRILKGAAPRDLPFQQPRKFDLILNAKAARELGVTLPKSLLARADQIIDQ
jgi:putative ABC transport system substrate-binding protein